MKPYTIALSAAFAVALSIAAPSVARASCPQRDTLELLKFGLTNVLTSFDGIRGAASGGGQYDLTPAAEAFCPTHFILERADAANGQPAYWVLKFNAHRQGSDDDVAAWIIKDFGPALKAGHYRLSHVGPDDLDGTQLYWVGPSGCWVTVETYSDDADSTLTDFEIRVGRDIP